MAFFSVFQVLSVTVFCLYLVGLLNNILSDTENACEMTYMFEYPQFVRVKVPENDQFPQYGMYAYSEGRFTEKSRKMRFDGVPVLFLPGNMGSYKQVRALASVALRKAISSSKYNFHFDYFAVDYNDEKSGLFGGVLERQTLFASKCLQAILNLYRENLQSKERDRPTTVIVIGHSMGGVIARGLMINPQNRNIVNLILTLASPHEMPVLNLDLHFSRYYQKINEYWEMKNLNTSNIAPNIWQTKVFITIGGGIRDFMVPSALTASLHSDINALTTSIPGVWLSTDHLCIVWCKQLVLVLNRLLFSVVDPSTRQLTADTANILNMGKHFLKIGQGRNNSYYNTPAEFIPDANWHEDIRRTFSVVHEKGVSKTWYYMVRLVDLPDYEMVTLEVVDVEDTDWLFGCQAKYVHGQHRFCMNGRHLSNYGQWTASNNGKRRIATLDLKVLRTSYPHWSHVILRVSPTNRPVQVNVDIHRRGSRSIQANIPAMYNFMHRTIISETHPNALMYNISLPGFDMLYQTYLFHVEPKGKCETAQTYHTSAKMIIPWTNGYEVYHVFTETQKNPMRLRLSKGNPNIKNSTQHVSILLTLDPQCIYSVSISSSPYDSLGQLSRYYTTSLPSYVSVVALLVLRHWAASMEAIASGDATKDVGCSFHSALCGEHVKPYYLLLSARLGTMFFISIPFLTKIVSPLKIGIAASQNFLLLPLLLFIAALGMMHILGAAVWGLLIFSGQLAHKILLRLVAVGRGGGGVRLWDWAASGLRKAPGAGGALLVALATASCGAVSLTAGAAFYFFLLTKMYEDYLEDLVLKTLAKISKKLRGKKTKKTEKNSDENSVESKEIAIISNSEAGTSSEKFLESESTLMAVSESKDIEDIPAKTSKEKTKDMIQAEKDNHEDEKSVAISKDALVGAGDDIKASNKKQESTQCDSALVPFDETESNKADDESNLNDTGDQEPKNKDSKSEDEEFSLLSLHFHFAMFVLWCLVTLLNIPALLTWAHNYRYSKVLEPDPSYIPGIVMCTSAAFLWQVETPRPNIMHYDLLQKFIYVIAVVVTMATPLALFRLNYLLSAVFAIITAHQMFPIERQVTASDTNDDDSPNIQSKGEETTAHEPEERESTNDEQSTQGPKIASSLFEEESDHERFKTLREKLESE